MKPIQTLVFLLVCLLGIGIVSWKFPKDGIAINDDFKLQFVTLDELFFNEEKEEKDLSNILSIIESETKDKKLEVDSNAIKAREQAIRDSIQKVNLKLHYKDNNKAVLNSFFAALDKVKAEGGKIRVMHYGDSQIEGDRMTSLFRNRWQNAFGGSGPGLVAPVPLVTASSIRQEFGDEWKRYTLYGARDTTVKHNRYGFLAGFGRFAPVNAFEKDTMYSGKLTFKKSYIGFKNTQNFSKCKIFYGYNKAEVTCEVYHGENLVSTHKLPANNSNQTLEINFGGVPNEFSFVFKGKDSPDFYGISFESNSGVIVDNIALRGSAGTIFGKIDKTLLQSQYDKLNVKLLILQFGGNVIPHIKSDKKAEDYAKWFASQIYRLKGMNPNASVIVIGPSDMSVKEKNEYVTQPYLEKVRDELKKASLDAGCAYFDIYEAMGGKNSMPLWVNAEPSLAAPDYIHFSQKGAQKMAELVYKAIEDDYKEYKAKKL